MTKKVWIGVLLTAAFVSLMFGVVDSAYAQSINSNSSDGTANSGNGYGTGLNDCIANGTGYGPGTGDGDCDREPPVDGSGNKYGAADRGAGYGDGTGLVNMAEWVSYSGTVGSVEDTVWTINLEDETEVEIYGRTLSFLNEQGFSANLGDSLVLTGFYHGDVFALGEIENVTTGATVLLRDENGRPLWTGNGRGSCWSD